MTHDMLRVMLKRLLTNGIVFRWILPGLIVFGLSACETREPALLNATVLLNTTNTVGPYQITAEVIGDPEHTVVELWYHPEGKEWTTIPFTHLDGWNWVAEIEGQPANTRVFYFVAAADIENLDDPEKLPEEAPTVKYSFRVIAP